MRLIERIRLFGIRIKIESSLIILYGRRRIGKTSLIKEFGKDKNMIHFLATEETEKQNLKQLSILVAEYLKLENIEFSDWDSVFKFIINSANDKKIVIVIDEFQYLGKVNLAFLSIFQRIWDNILKDKNVNIQINQWMLMYCLI